ncbi:MAG TPA: DUF3810 domain-containing protein [Ruminococcus sp.]|nr:DUF3810 domain-containing protein [Ruminococcus sp.]
MKKRFLIPIILILFSAVLTVCGRLSQPFADFYAAYIFPWISTPYAFLSGLVPISLGELMILAGIVLVAAGIPLMIILLIFCRKSRTKVAKTSLTIALWALAFVSVTESLNCFTLYGCTRFSDRYFKSKVHTNEELSDLYGKLITQCNQLAGEVPRDEHDRFVLTIDVVSEAKAAMKKASRIYPQLSGYYPRPKPIMFSYFMSQSNLQGMYLPFAMEASYNDDMVKENLPETICHEYSHLKGFMQEDEANFISFVATMESDEPQMKYGGCLCALEYVHNQVYSNHVESAYPLTALISPQVTNDWFRFMPDNYWEENEDKELISTDTVSSVSSAASDKSMKLNGVEDGIKSYSRMVNLLLDYYYPPEE